MSGFGYSPPGIRSEASAYFGFRGMDRSKDISAMEREEGLNFWLLENGYADHRGQILREQGMALFSPGNRNKVINLRFYSTDSVVFVEEDQAAIHFVSDRGPRLENALPRGAVVSSTNFRGEVAIFSADGPIRFFDGFAFRDSQARVRPAFGTPVQRRLAVAGFRDRPTVVELSRVDTNDTFLEEERSTTEVTRAGFIDIANLIGTADRITGLGTFEGSRLAVFTADQLLVYLIAPDLEEWSLDSRASLRIGCVAHNTIANAGSDLIFCSRRGIHSLMRSAQNGITIEEASLSDDLEDLYRELVLSVQNPEAITATYDPDDQTYHVWFPQADGVTSRRLSMRFRANYEVVNFHLGTELNTRAGAFLGGRMMFGAADGVYEAVGRFTTVSVPQEQIRRAPFIAETPILWLGDLMSTKRGHTLIVQASGEGRVFLDVMDELGHPMTTVSIDLKHRDGDRRFPLESIAEDFTFPLNHVFRGVRLRFRTEEGDTRTDVRLTSFALLTHKEK